MLAALRQRLVDQERRRQEPPATRRLDAAQPAAALEPIDTGPPDPLQDEVSVETEALESMENTTHAASQPAPQPEANPEPSDEDLWEEPPPEPEPRVKRPSSPARPGELPRRRVVVIDENPDIDIEASREEPPPPPGTNEQREGMADIGATLDDEPARKRRWRLFRKGGD